MIVTELDGTVKEYPPGTNAGGVGFTAVTLTHDDMLASHDWLLGMLSRLCPQKAFPAPHEK